MMLTYDTSILSLACTFTYTCVCVWGGGALVRFSAWVAASKRWCLIDCTMCRPTRHFVSGPIFTKQPSIIEKLYL